MTRFILTLLIVAVLIVGNAQAGNSVFAKFFEIDLENDVLPQKADLEKMLDKYSGYNPKFSSPFDLVGNFDSEFAATIASYGHQEKRIKPINEDAMIDAIKQFPPIYYQYIGPQLFEAPGISEKILNMPGIKETKNKFPTRIAKELENMEGLEFLSPSLYFMLMPEAWPSYEGKIEEAEAPLYFPKIKYNPKLFAFIKKIVPFDKYRPNGKASQSDVRDSLRTIFPDANTTLTAADVKAISIALDKVENWFEQPENKYQIYKIDTLLSLYEREDELGQFVNSEIRNMVNPCARFVQKLKILGKEDEVAKLVASQGFKLNEWAYSCDKMVHAYRLSHINYGVMQSIRLFQRGIYDSLYNRFSLQSRNSVLAVMQAYIKGYQAPLRDVMAVKKHRAELDEKIKNRRFLILGHPVFFD